MDHNEKIVENIYDILVQSIVRRGFGIVGVFDDKKQSFCYTVGLSEKYGFELIMRSFIPVDDMVHLLECYSKEDVIEMNAHPLEDFFSYEIAGEIRDIRFVDVSNQAEINDFIYIKLNESPTKFYQLVMADQNGIFPYCSGYDVDRHGQDLSKK